MEILFCLIVAYYFVTRGAADLFYAAKGELPARHQVRRARLALANPDRPERYGFRGFMADLAEDCWIDADEWRAERRKARKAAKTAEPETTSQKEVTQPEVVEDAPEIATEDAPPPEKPTSETEPAETPATEPISANPVEPTPVDTTVPDWNNWQNPFAPKPVIGELVTAAPTEARSHLKLIIPEGEASMSAPTATPSTNGHAGSGEVTNIQATRTYLDELATHVDGEILANLELAQSVLSGHGLDKDVDFMGKFTTVGELFQSAASVLREIRAEHDSKHNLMEEAVNSTPDAADVDYYRHA